ncbi:MAG: hypothetical protein PWQ83_553 [Thermosipho sp. (in: thermotogales)]|nr:hypothetical protein [Thermosipho sp. (in: thermotogales)]MDK2900274.1 hypothetical protein [Thermosipho sp. (in: thermotogales)]
MFFENVLKDVPNELSKEVFKAKSALEKNFNDSQVKRNFIEITWELYRYLLENIDENYEVEKRLFLRYGLLEPRYLNSRDFERIKSIPFVDDKENIFYVDEWLLAVKKGLVNESSFMEVIESRKNVAPKNVASFEMAFNEKSEERKFIERQLREIVKGIEDEGKPYRKSILSLIDQAIEKLKKLKLVNKEVEIIFEQLNKLKEESQINEKTEDNFSKKIMEHEVIIQMINKSIGRLGNRFLVLTSIFLNGINAIGSKDLIESKLNEFEKIDYKIFERKIRGTSIKLKPYFIIVPGYGDYGFCWEPFEGLNVISGRGRVVIPMFPKNIDVAILSALGDYRLKAAKELAFGRWMEEGLTGEIYNYLMDNKIRERIDEFFVKRYILWILKESNGVQKLEKEIREIFWRYVEFPEEIKAKLSNISYIYSNLYEKDKRRKKNWENL